MISPAGCTRFIEIIFLYGILLYVFARCLHIYFLNNLVFKSNVSDSDIHGLSDNYDLPSCPLARREACSCHDGRITPGSIARQPTYHVAQVRQPAAAKGGVPARTLFCAETVRASVGRWAKRHLSRRAHPGSRRAWYQPEGRAHDRVSDARLRRLVRTLV